METSQNQSVTIVCPAHNESIGIHSFTSALMQTMAEQNILWEIIFVDDGSSDDTWQQIEIVSKDNQHIHGVKLSKNYGKDWAIQAGLRSATGDAIIVIDSDLQHPVEVIPQLIEKWREGFDIVIATKTTRPDQSSLVKAGSKLWGKLFSNLSGISIYNTTDFRLLSARAKSEVISRSGNRPFFRGDSSSIGFNTATVEFEPAKRVYGKSKYKLTTLFQLAVRSITSFTVKPLHFVTAVSLLTMIAATILLVQTFINWVTHHSADGFTTVISIVLLLGSFQLLGIGIIGEYLGLIVENLDKKKEVIVETQTNFD